MWSPRESRVHIKLTCPDTCYLSCPVPTDRPYPPPPFDFSTVSQAEGLIPSAFHDLFVATLADTGGRGETATMMVDSMASPPPSATPPSQLGCEKVSGREQRMEKVSGREQRMEKGSVGACLAWDFCQLRQISRRRPAFGDDERSAWGNIVLATTSASLVAGRSDALFLFACAFFHVHDLQCITKAPLCFPPPLTVYCN